MMTLRQYRVWHCVSLGYTVALVRHINSQINQLLAQKETIDRFSVTGAKVLPSTPEEFDRVIRVNLVRWVASGGLLRRQDREGHQARSYSP